MKEVVGGAKLGNENKTNSTLGSYFEILSESRVCSGIMLLRHSIRPSFKGMSEAGRDDVSLTNEGRKMAIDAGDSIGKTDLVLSSPVLRCVQTAELMLPRATVISSESLCSGPFGDEWLRLKEEVGWSNAIRKWVDGDFKGSRSVQDVGGDIIQYLTEIHTIGSNTLVISHDIAILAVAELLGMRFGEISVPELGGIFIGDGILGGE